MLRLAAFVHLLPASQAHHHRGAGGMLRHSLEVALFGRISASQITSASMRL
jgi:conjugal transfer pilus assembly protein TraI